jgi:RNA polymerase sigma-70 factor (ECF subfamily)
MTTTDRPTETPRDTAALDRYRPELLAHCYRMLGSVHDAEDLVQETYLRAWRSQDTFEGRSSMRTWLYRIATNACLTALESRGRRPLPTGLGQDASDPFGSLVQQPEVPWLEPVPDVLLSELPDDPAAVVTSRESIRLAFVAALQNLPPRQRAVLVLREVLAWRASEVAEALGTSTAAVNSMLQRARAQLEQAALERDDVVEPDDPQQRELLDRYVAAFETYDVAAIVEMFTEDAIWEMPPFTGWYQGARTIGNLISTQCPASGPADMRMLRADANGQPAFALYMRDPVDGAHKAFQIQVLTLTDGRVSHVGCFFDTRLFGAFGLPETYPGGLPARAPAPAHG